jgi:DNA polymerase IIIc chi subunit
VVALLASVDFFENAPHHPSFTHLSPASTAVHIAVKKGNQGEEHEHQTLISGRDSSPFAELHVSIEILKLFKQVRIYVVYMKLPSHNTGPQTV